MATPTPAASETAASFGEHASAYATDRESQFLELAAEMPGDDAAPEPADLEAGRSPAESETDSGDEDATDAEASDGADPQATPADAADNADADTDPMAGAVPFAYTVNGEAKTLDGVQEIPGKGAIVTPDALSDLRDRIQYSDHARTVTKQLNDEVQPYRAIEFNGQKGMHAVVELHATNAKLNDAVRLLASVIENPDQLYALASDPDAMARLQERLAFTADKADFTARRSFGQKIAETGRAEQTQAEQVTLQTQAVQNATEKWAAQFPSLTVQDKLQAAQYMAQFRSTLVRPATPDEARQAGVKPGDPILDERPIHQYLQGIATLRTEQAALAKTTAKAATENSKRLAATLAPSRPKATPTAARPAAASPKAPSEAELWQKQRLRMESGQFSVDTDED